MLSKTRTGLLLDYYGELLTVHQRRIMRLYADDDLSFAEVAEVAGVTRQAVADIVLRASKKLEETEEKLGLVAKIKGAEEYLDGIIAETGDETLKNELFALKGLLRNI